MEWISTNEVVASTKLQLGIDHNNLDNYFKILAIEAEKQIKSRQTISDFPVQQLKVHDNVLPLPAGFVQLNKMLGYQKGSNQAIKPDYLPSSFYKCEKESPNLKNDRTDGQDQKAEVWYNREPNAFGQGSGEFLQEYYRYTFELQRNHAFFSDDCDFEYVDLAYKGYNLDENGDLLIPENHERAIRYYIIFNHKLEDNYSTQGQVQMYSQMWAQQKSQIRGDDALLSREEQRFGNLVLSSLISPKRMEY